MNRWIELCKAPAVRPGSFDGGTIDAVVLTARAVKRRASALPPRTGAVVIGAERLFTERLVRAITLGSAGRTAGRGEPPWDSSKNSAPNRSGSTPTPPSGSKASTRSTTPIRTRSPRSPPTIRIRACAAPRWPASPTPRVLAAIVRNEADDAAREHAIARLAPAGRTRGDEARPRSAPSPRSPRSAAQRELATVARASALESVRRKAASSR